MNINKIKSFAKYARKEADKANINPQKAKQGYINMIINGYCSANKINLHRDDSIIPQNIKERFCSVLLSGACFDAESLSWLYMYFVNTDRENTVDAISGLEIKSDEICASTQVFTPEWIVKYLVDNSLGNFCTLHKPQYLINCVEKPNQKNVWDISLLDPCCGCGNILIYAFDMFMSLYIEAGYSKDEAAQMILKHNIFGADIDEYATQIAKFSLMAKAYQYNYTVFVNNITPNIYVVNTPDGAGSLKSIPSHKKQFTVVCTNPPYLTRMSKPLKEFLNKTMKPYSKDLFTAFMYRGLNYLEDGGYLAYMTPNVWLYLTSHKNIREYIIHTHHICSLIQLEKGSYFSEASVDICAFVIKKDLKKDGIYIDLKSTTKGIDGQKQALIQTLNDINCGTQNKNVYFKNQNDFSSHSEKLIIYSAPQHTTELFKGTSIGDVYAVKQGMTTGNNKKFLRYWWEVDYNDIGFNMQSTEMAAKSGKKWFPYNKGGKFRKWYGNNEYVVMYQNDGEQLKEYTSHLPQGTWVRLKSREYYFKSAVTWSFISSTRFGVRYSPCGSIFDVAGSSLFADEPEYVLGFLGSSTAFYLLQLINPSMNYQIRDIKALPYIEDKSIKEQVVQLVKNCIQISKQNWDSFETSYDFKVNPLINKFKGYDLKCAIDNYLLYCSDMAKNLAQYETKINMIFAKLYGTEDIVCQKVEPKDVSLIFEDEKSVIYDLISYCVGVALERFTKNAILSSNKCATIKQLCCFTYECLKNNFSGTEYIFDVLKMSLDEYFEKHFIKHHTKKYKNKPIYKTDGTKIWL